MLKVIAAIDFPAARRVRLGAACMVLLCALKAGSAWAAATVTEADLQRFDRQKTVVALRNGERLAYIDTGRPHGPPLVLIHGYTDSARDWLPAVPWLAPRFRLIIVDLRGHGASGKPQCCYSRFDFAYDIKLLLDSLQVRKADIAGHSLGSIVAQAFAELWPGSTRHLILVSSTGLSFTPNEQAGSSTPPGTARWLADIEKLQDPIDPDSAFMRDWWRESISINPRFFSRRQRQDAAAIPAQVWRAIADQSLVGVDLSFMLARIRAPTLLIWGGRDTTFSDAGRQALRTGIRGAEVRTFDSLGHDLFWQEPRAVADAMIDFLTTK